MNDIDESSIRRGTGNVFADLGYAGPDTHLLKAELVREVMRVKRDRGLTQTDVAKATGLSQPDVSRLLEGQFRDVSVERIMKVLSRLGCEIDIVVISSSQKEPSPVIHFQSAPA